MKIVIVMEGGVIQDITCDGDCEVMVIDYDVEGADEDALAKVDQGGDADSSFGSKLAAVYVHPIEVASDYVSGRHAAFKVSGGSAC